MTTAPNRSATARGFAIYDEFPDSHGSEVRVQLSSAAALYDGDLNEKLGPRVWVFCFDRNDEEKVASPHLDIAGARRLRNALNTFIRESK